MAIDRALDHAFWLRGTADAITAELPEEHQALVLIAVRRIHSTRRVAAMVRPIV